MSTRNPSTLLKSLLLTTVLALPAVPLAGAEPVRTVEAKDAGKQVRLRPGQTLVVRLGVQMGTGFSWKAALPDGGLLTQEGEPAVEPGGGKDRPGAWETQVFRFTAQTAGSGKLAFAYARSFEPGKKPVRTLRYRIVVASPEK